MHKYATIFAGLTVTIFVFLTSAQVHAESQQSVHQICQMSPAECLEQVPALLKASVHRSRLYYHYKLYQLEALLNLGHFQQLHKELTPWLEDESVPLRFRMAVLTYHAKVLHIQQKTAQSRSRLQQAVALMSQISKQFPSPMTMIEIANLQLYLDKADTAFKTLKQIESRHLRHSSPVFKRELYANMAQAMNKLGKLEQHLVYRQQALHWAIEAENPQQIAVGWHNVARAHQFLNQYIQADEPSAKPVIMHNWLQTKQR